MRKRTRCMNFNSPKIENRCCSAIYLYGISEFGKEEEKERNRSLSLSLSGPNVFGYRALFHFDKGGSERADKGCDECARRHAAPGKFALKGNFIHL